MVRRHPIGAAARRGARRHPVRSLGAAAAGLAVVGGSMAIYGATGIGVAPAADTVLSCTDTWTGSAGTTDWNTAANWSAGVPDAPGVDACISGGATVVEQDATAAVGELTVAKGSTLAVSTAGAGATPSTGAGLAVSSGLDNDGTLTAGPSDAGTSTLTLDGPVTNTGAIDVLGAVSVGAGAVSSVTNAGTLAVGPGGVLSLGQSSTLTNAANGLLAFGIDGPPTSPSDAGRITNGALSLGGSVAPVFESGFTPPPGAEYVVADSAFSGTFATVRSGATADYSHPASLGLVGGARPRPRPSASRATSRRRRSVRTCSSRRP